MPPPRQQLLGPPPASLVPGPGPPCAVPATLTAPSGGVSLRRCGATRAASTTTLRVRVRVRITTCPCPACSPPASGASSAPRPGHADTRGGQRGGERGISSVRCTTASGVGCACCRRCRVQQAAPPGGELGLTRCPLVLCAQPPRAQPQLRRTVHSLPHTLRSTARPDPAAAHRSQPQGSGTQNRAHAPVCSLCPVRPVRHLTRLRGYPLRLLSDDLRVRFPHPLNLLRKAVVLPPQKRELLWCTVEVEIVESLSGGWCV